MVDTSMKAFLMTRVILGVSTLREFPTTLQLTCHLTQAMSAHLNIAGTGIKTIKVTMLVIVPLVAHLKYVIMVQLDTHMMYSQIRDHLICCLLMWSLLITLAMEHNGSWKRLKIIVALKHLSQMAQLKATTAKI